jgi:hypothetical protein
VKRRTSWVVILFLVLVIALASFGVAYTAWTDRVTIGGTAETGDLDWEFLGPVGQSDLGLDPNCFFDLFDGEWVTQDKDVANTTVIIEAPNRLSVTVNNAYPYYGNHIVFKFHGLGSIPLKFWKMNIYAGDETTPSYTWYMEDQYAYLDFNNDGGDDLQLWWGDSFGDQFHFCSKRDVSFEFLVLQPAQQGKVLTFTIEFIGIQWNEYVPGPHPDACEKFLDDV